MSHFPYLSHRSSFITWKGFKISDSEACHPDTFKMVWNESAFLHVSKDWRDLGTKPSLYHNALEREETGISQQREDENNERHIDFDFISILFSSALLMVMSSDYDSQKSLSWDPNHVACETSVSWHQDEASITIWSLWYMKGKRETWSTTHTQFESWCPGKWTDREQNKEQKPRSPTERAWSDPLLRSPVHYILAADTDTGSEYLWSS